MLTNSLTPNPEFALSFSEQEQQTSLMLEFSNQLTLSNIEQTQKTFDQIMKEFKRTLTIYDEKDQILGERVSQVNKRTFNLEEEIVKNEKLRIGEKNVTEEKFKALNQGTNELRQQYVQISNSLAKEINANTILREQKLVADNRIVTLEGRVATLEAQLQRSEKNFNDHLVSHKVFVESVNTRFKSFGETQTAHGLRFTKVEGSIEGNAKAVNTSIASINDKIQALNKEISACNTNLGKYKTEVAGSLDQINKSKAATDARVKNCETAQAAHAKSIVDLDKRVTAQGTTQANQNVSIAGLDTRIKAQVTTQTAQATTQTAQGKSIADLDTRVKAQATTQTNQGKSVVSLDERVKALQTAQENHTHISCKRRGHNGAVVRPVRTSNAAGKW